MDCDNCFTVGVVVGMTMLGITFLIANAMFPGRDLLDEAIKRGFAIYDPITGERRWKEPTEQGPTP